MVHHATLLSMATSPSPSSSISPGFLWDPAPAHLTPPLHFILKRVDQCLDEFVRREQTEWKFIEGLEGLVHDIEVLIRKYINAQNVVGR